MMTTGTTHGPGPVFALIERVGKRVPHPFLLFWYLLVLLAVASAVLAATGASSRLPGADAPTRRRRCATSSPSRADSTC